MSGKVNVNSAFAYRLIHPMHTVLVSCVGKSSKPNIITLAWAMPTSAIRRLSRLASHLRDIRIRLLRKLKNS